MNMLQPRVGIGHDTHRLVPGEGMKLGGVWVPFEKKLLGHSDADVLLHAVTDAILGAAAMGDIGELFPDTDPANAGRSSIEMLRLAYAKVREAGWVVRNLDTIVFAQRPKLSEYKTAIARKIAETLEITPQQVNVKAKTGEGVGPVGEGLVIEAQCVAMIIPTRGLTQDSLQTLTAARPLSVSASISAPVVTPPRAQADHCQCPVAEMKNRCSR